MTAKEARQNCLSYHEKNKLSIEEIFSRIEEESKKGKYNCIISLKLFNRNLTYKLNELGFTVSEGMKCVFIEWPYCGSCGTVGTHRA